MLLLELYVLNGCWEDQLYPALGPLVLWGMTGYKYKQTNKIKCIVFSMLIGASVAYKEKQVGKWPQVAGFSSHQPPS